MAGMKIRRLEVEGYKSLKKIVWEPGDLNVFLGPNGGGKSNLIRLLELLSGSARGELEDFISKDGGIGAILWDGSAERIVIKLEIVKPLDEKKGTRQKIYSCLNYELILLHSKKWNRYLIEHESLKDHTEIISDPNEADADKQEKSEKSKPRASVVQKDADSATVRRNDGGPLVLESTKESETLVSEFVHNAAVDPLIDDFTSYVTGFRFHYDPNTGYKSPIRNPSITKYDNRLEPDGSNLVNFLHTQYTENYEFRAEVDASMRAALGPEYEELIFSPAADQYIQMRIRWGNLKWQQPASALSDGILKYLYIITILSSPAPPSLITIDNVATGLNPSVFAVITELAAAMSEKTQVIITTHSPEFVNSFENITPTTTIFGITNGATEMNTISADELKKWLNIYRLREKQ